MQLSMRVLVLQMMMTCCETWRGETVECWKANFAAPPSAPEVVQCNTNIEDPNICTLVVH